MNATDLIKLRTELKKSVPDITYLPFFMKAISLALVEFPELNCNVSPDVDEEGYIKEYVVKRDHNFSIAIDTADGLKTPNIKQV